MKYYERNRVLSFVLLGFTSTAVAAWIALLVLHSHFNQWIDINTNFNFFVGYTTCSSSFIFTSTGGLDYPTIDSSAAYSYGMLKTQNHPQFQFISIVMLFASGPLELMVLVLTVFLLLKSRQPYKEAWFLASIQKLKIAMHVFSWLALTTAGVYWGYTFSFMTLGFEGCVSSQLQLYAVSYFLSVIIGGILTAFSLVVYLMTLGIRLPDYTESDPLLRTEEDSRLPLHALEANVEAQKNIAQRLSQLPKINVEQQIEMTEQQPSGFGNSHNSRPRYTEQALPPPIYQELTTPKHNKQSTMYPIYQPNHQGSKISRNPTPSPKVSNAPPASTAYYYVPDSYAPVALEEIEVHVDDRLNDFNNKDNNQSPQERYERHDTDSRILGELYMSPSKANGQPSNSRSSPNDKFVSPGQKSRLKIFHRATNPSKEKAVLSQLKSRYGYM